MSETVLRFVPADPRFQPLAAAAARAERMLRALLPDASSIRAEYKDSIVFFDPGGNWSGVECPLCNSDAEEWWGEAMSAAHQRGFEPLEIVTGCCGRKLSLNDLRYKWPTAFGKFVLEADNPNSTGLSDDDLATLAECLGTKLKQIWVRI